MIGTFIGLENGMQSLADEHQGEVRKDTFLEMSISVETEESASLAYGR